MTAHSKRVKDLPTMPASAARLGIFQSTRRPTHRTGEWQETTWGSARVTGRLGQQHADLIETILHTALQPHWGLDNRLRLLVDPYQVRKGLGAPAQPASYEQTWVTVRATMEAVIEIRNNAGQVGMGHIIETVETAAVDADNPLFRGRATGASPSRWRTQPAARRVLWRVTLGAPWVSLIKNDVGRHYDPRPIINLKHGISQALARLMLTHARGTSEVLIETALEQIRACGRMRDRRDEIASDQDALAGIGIIMDGKMVRY